MPARQAYAILAATFIALCLLAYVLFRGSTLPTAPAATRNEPPPMTPLMQEQLAKSTGFQHLVSYSDTGFAPRSLAVKKGEAVRFTNNSSQVVWVASADYPGRSECGGTSFDTCVVLQPYEFWEFTFDEQGTWTYKNNADTQFKASITVEVK